MNLQPNFALLLGAAQALVVGFAVPDLMRSLGRKWIWASAAVALGISVVFSFMINGINEPDTLVMTAFLGVLTLGVSILRVQSVTASIEKQLSEAPAVVSFAKRYFDRLAPNGVINRAILWELLEDGGFSDAQRPLVKYLDAHLDEIGHVADHIFVSAGPMGHGAAVVPVYVISRADLDSYLARVRSKYHRWC